MKVDIYNLKKEVVGTVELPDAIFNRPWNGDLVHQILLAQQANRRKPLAHVRMRGEVRGGGKKPWRQKGTGRARHGSIRSPLWHGGGKSHGPRKDKSYAQKVNKKMLRAALHAALSRKLRENELRIVDEFSLGTSKTKDFFLKIKGWRSALLVPKKEDTLLYRVSRNIPKVKALAPAALNVEDVIRFKNVLIDKEAISQIR